MRHAGSFNRRSFLAGAAGGFFGANILGHGPFGTNGLLGPSNEQDVRAQCNLAAAVHGASPLAPRATHYPAKAKQLVIVWLAGGFSHVDTFDPKPKLQSDHGKLVISEAKPNMKFPLVRSPFSFKQYGECGMWISELFPYLSTVADDLAFIRSMRTDPSNHVEASLALHSGSGSVPLPSIGAWISYGLGTLNPNLPPYIVLSKETPFAGTQTFDNNFLPPIHQGVRITPGREPIPNLQPATTDLTLRQLEQEMVQDANEFHESARPGDLVLAAASNTFEMARGMTRVATDVLDISDETKATLEMYDVQNKKNKSLGWSCLMVRRMIERGVRVVELIDNGTILNWDSHTDILADRAQAKPIDQPLTALIKDMKQRGLLDDTLIAICTEFGRTPWADPPTGGGRNHHPGAFTCMLAGAGVKPGTICGETDDYGTKVIADQCHMHDYHATILHLMGLDHTRLTYRYAGRNFRLTDVHGNIMQKLLS